MTTDRIDMSLDDIIKTSKSPRGRGRGRGRGGRGARGGGRGGRNGSRTSAGARGGVTRRSTTGRGGSRGGPRGRYRRGNAEDNWEHDLYDGPRRGSVATPSGPGKLIVSNLDFGVSESDIQELFSEFGKLRKASVHYDRSGRSLGSADVHFERKSDAVKAMKQYNGVPLDGRAMKIELVGAPPVTPQTRPNNLSPTRKVGRSGDGGGRRRSSGRVEKPGRGVKAGRGRGGRGGRAKKEPAPSAEELDKELDTYLKAR